MPDFIIHNTHYNYFKPFTDRKPYLTFSSSDEFTLKTSNGSKNWNGSLYYSTDTENWSEWNGATISSSGGKLYLRGKNNTYLGGTDGVGRPLRITPSNSNIVDCLGNIENLLDWETAVSGSHPVMANWCFFRLFANCSYLGSAPELPATALSKYCYRYMFDGCTSLTTAPALPATSLEDYCYEGMFADCTSLTTAPALPATTLAPSCYAAMFTGCTSLTTAPALPATTLASSCYNQMFSECNSLSVLPKLSTALNIRGCAYMMFYMCPLVMVSETQTGEYQTALCTPSAGQSSMFSYTGGTYKDSAVAGTTYYTSNQVV